MQVISVSAIVGLVIMTIVCAIAYGCINSNNQYYQMASECTKAGGSFIPTSAANDKAICLNTRDHIAPLPAR